MNLTIVQTNALAQAKPILKLALATPVEKSDHAVLAMIDSAMIALMPMTDDPAMEAVATDLVMGLTRARLMFIQGKKPHGFKHMSEIHGNITSILDAA